MASMLNFIRKVLLSMITFFSDVLSFLGRTRKRFPASVTDPELGGTAADAMVTPGTISSRCQNISGTYTPPYTPFPDKTITRCTLTESAGHPSDHLELYPSPPSTDTDETSTEECSVESSVTSGAATAVDEAEDVQSSTTKDQVVTPDKKGDVDEPPRMPKQAFLEFNVIAESQSLDSGINESVRYSVALDDCGETRGAGITDEADHSERYFEVNSDDDNIYEDDPEVPSHRSLKLAIDYVWCHKVPNTIKEVDEEGIEQKEEGSICRTEIALVTSPTLTIVVQSPTLGNSLHRAREATEELAAFLKFMEGESFESTSLPYADSTEDSDTGTAFGLGYDWYGPTIVECDRTSSEVYSQNANSDLLRVDPFAKSSTIAGVVENSGYASPTPLRSFLQS